MNTTPILVLSIVSLVAMGGCELFPMDSGGGNDRPANRDDRPATPVEGPGSGSAEQFDGRVTGTVTYLQRIAMPPDAVITVKLVDVSRADAPGATIAEQVIRNPGNVPVAFTLAFDNARIDQKHIYQVQARLTSGGNLMFATAKSYQVLTRGKGNSADVVLEMAN